MHIAVPPLPRLTALSIGTFLDTPLVTSALYFPGLTALTRLASLSITATTVLEEEGSLLVTSLPRLPALRTLHFKVHHMQVRLPLPCMHAFQTHHLAPRATVAAGTVSIAFVIKIFQITARMLPSMLCYAAMWCGGVLSAPRTLCVSCDTIPPEGHRTGVSTGLLCRISRTCKLPWDS